MLEITCPTTPFVQSCNLQFVKSYFTFKCNVKASRYKGHFLYSLRVVGLAKLLKEKLNLYEKMILVIYRTIGIAVKQLSRTWQCPEFHKKVSNSQHLV